MKIYTLLFLVFCAGCSVFGQNEKNDAVRSAEPDRISLQPCEVADTKEKVLCGALDVFENRALGKGRKIRLKIVVYPATGPDKAPDPLFYIPGGPGSSATEDAPYIAQEFAALRERRDLVFVDQRGTGGSNLLFCEFFDETDPQSLLGHWNPPEKVRACREKLEARADLKLYTTPIAMDDLNDVRAALGYEKINIFGGSYGTRATQNYLKRYGKHVRTAILHGVSLPGQFMPRDFPQDTERALQGVLDECAADAACRNAFPDLKTDVKTVLERLLREGAVEVDVRYPQNSPNTRRLKLPRDLAAEAVRYMLYQSGAASRLPLYLHLAAQGNFVPLAQSALFYRRNLVATGATGMYLSVTCAEDLPWIKAGEGERYAENTFLGDYRLRQQREACREWVRSEIPKDYSEPVRSDVPVLILSGQWDPVTPPAYGDMAAKHLPNSLHIVVPSGGHGFSGLSGIECISRLKIEFINRGTAKGLDTSCVKSIRRNAFLLKL
jgi:pimeloyl-ACP methyl ester carboxylesterase